MARLLLIFAAFHGLAAVALGAFGAHGLQNRLADAVDGAKRLGWWTTGSHYQLTHAIVIAVVATLLMRQPSTPLQIAGGLFTVGALIFPGTLYAMALGAPRWLGAITPIGGLFLIGGWATLLFAAWRMS